jgi:hypothetical protein
METYNSITGNLQNEDQDLNNIISINISEEMAAEEFDFDFDYDPNEMYYELAAQKD